MLSYQHGYHAGCFADVVKHITLTRLLHYMTNKEKPIFYLETHAGRGMYDLHDKQSLKTGEAQQGIELLWAQRNHLPEVFLPYIQHITHINEGPTLRYYPGSPAIAIEFARQQDRLVFSELHPGEFEHLQNLPRMNKRVYYSNNDGLDNLNAILPPVERRGLIFIDPSYEIKNEYRQLPSVVKTAYKKFATGVYCIWYPLIDNKLHAQLIRGLENIGTDNHLRIEFHLTGAMGAGMMGCGLWIINPPYVLATELALVLDSLRKLFNPGVSSYLIG